MKKKTEQLIAKVTLHKLNKLTPKQKSKLYKWIDQILIDFVNDKLANNFRGILRMKVRAEK